MPNQRQRSLAVRFSVRLEAIERRIYLIRGQKVMLDNDLAELYGVTTGNLNLAVRRNQGRFPEDFMFRLTPDESRFLLLQVAISKGRGGRRTAPYAFTEQGVAMLSSVLHSERAVQVNIVIMRAFVKLRELMSTHAALARKIHDLEKKYQKHEAHLVEFRQVFDALKKLIQAPIPIRRRIGFLA